MLFFWRSAVLRSGDGDDYHGLIRLVLGHRVSLYVRIVVMVRIRDPIQVVEGEAATSRVGGRCPAGRNPARPQLNPYIQTCTRAYTIYFTCGGGP